MTSETGEPSPEMYQKLVSLSELIIERNNLLGILGDFKRTKTTLSPNQMNILTNQFLSKVNLIDKQMSRVATGITCSVCQKSIAISDQVLACELCGSPAHTEHILKHVKEEGYCPACGENLKYYIKGSLKTITHDLFKCSVNAFSAKVHSLKIYYEDQLIAQPIIDMKTECPKCKRPISADWKFCRSCGLKLEPIEKHKVEMQSCARCGRQIKTTWKFCKMCGHPIANSG